jgi:hypothetical protein
VKEWLSGPFYKAVCRVSDEDFERAKEAGAFVSITESALAGSEVALGFRPRSSSCFGNRTGDASSVCVVLFDESRPLLASGPVREPSGGSDEAVVGPAVIFEDLHQPKGIPWRDVDLVMFDGGSDQYAVVGLGGGHRFLRAC